MKVARGKFRMGWFGLVFLASVMMFGCGGGGGDEGGGAAPQPAPTVPEVLNYAVSPQWYSAPDLLRSTLAGTTPVTFSLTDIRATGTYNRVTTATTLANSSMIFTVAPNPYGAGTLTIGVLIPSGTTVRWVGRANPTEGAFQLNITTVGLGFDRVMVTVNSLPGVTIEAFNLNTSVFGPVQLTWVEFDAVEDDPAAPTYQKVARLGYSGWQTVYKKISLAYTNLEGIVTNDSALQSSKSITLNGTTFPAAGAATLKITWIDDGNGELGPNDDFDSLFTEWWVNSPGDIDDLYNGALSLTGYTETPNSIGGDFAFINLTEEETQNNSILTDIVTTNGGFNLTLSW